MGNLQGKHYFVLGALLVSLGTELAGLKHGWADAVTPTFVGSLCIQIGTVVGALYTGAPHKEWDGTDRRDSFAPAAAPKPEQARIV